MAKRIEEGRIIFPKNQTGRPRNKIFMDEMESSNKAFSSVITEMNTGDGSKELKNIFGANEFSFPKPSNLIGFLLGQITDKNDIILDSFAGSGTTAHAVLNLNLQDEGNRKFILVEMEEYAETITAERVKRVINGYADKEGTLGSFDYYELGQSLFLEDGNLNENVGIEKIRKYIYYTETKQYLNQAKQNDDNVYFLDKHNDTSYYLNYEQDEITTLDHDFLATMKNKAEQYIIYADNCLLKKDFMTNRNIIFKKIPRDITRF
jgi:adenine-specific DNA-methyltransferase